PAVYDKKTADGGPCDLRKTHHTGLAFRNCLPVGEGDYCDGLSVCVPASAAADIAAIAPDFHCETAGGCRGVRCGMGGVVDTQKFAQMCAITTSGVTLLREMECIILER